MEAPVPDNATMRRASPPTNPVVQHMLAGIGVSLIFLLCVGAIVLALYLSSKSSGDLSGLGGVVGFMIVPLVALVGAPWSLLSLVFDNSQLLAVGVIGGPILNGTLLGALSGYFAARRQARFKEVSIDRVA